VKDPKLVLNRQQRIKNNEESYKTYKVLLISNDSQVN
jgi:hypothetical protein